MGGCTAMSAIGVTWQSSLLACYTTGTSIHSRYLPWLQTTWHPSVTGPCCASAQSTLVGRPLTCLTLESIESTACSVFPALVCHVYPAEGTAAVRLHAVPSACQDSAHSKVCCKAGLSRL